MQIRYRLPLTAAILFFVGSSPAQNAAPPTPAPQREKFQEAAAKALETENTRRQAEPCKDAMSTYEINHCLWRELSITQRNRSEFAAALRSLLRLRDPADSKAPKFGPSGPVLTSDELAEEFDRMETQWEGSQKLQCEAALHQYGGGTAAPAAQMGCELRLTREHLDDLDVIYNMLLHK